MENVLPEIPRLYTAFTEWAACLIFIILQKKRISIPKLTFLSFWGLLGLSAFLMVTDEVPIFFWIPCMAIAFGSMVLFIYVACDVSVRKALYFAVHAFVLSEFMAFLDSLIYNFESSEGKIYDRIDNFVPASVVSFLNLVFVTALTMLASILLLRKHLNNQRQVELTNRDITIAAVIGVLIFAASNISFLTSESILSGTYYLEIVKLHMMIDLSGVLILYTHFVRCHELYIQHELEAVQNVLQNQYQQYKQSRESIDLINYKYHDLKHQIGILRKEQDDEKRNAYLDQMEEEIKQYELQNKTGNKVLDTVLTGKSMYCDKHGITLTSVADGTLLEHMDTMDICSIFGNALDNAIESVLKLSDKEKRLIHVTVAKQKNFLMIRVENYFEGDLSVENGKIASTKKNKQFHGYGIKSIEYIVEKYQGALSIDTKNNWFDLKILIPLQT